MSKYVVLVNDGLYEGGKVFGSKDELRKMLLEWNDGVNEFEDDNEIKYDVDGLIERLIEKGVWGEKLNVVNESMCEYGDDYVELSVCDIDEESD